MKWPASLSLDERRSLAAFQPARDEGSRARAQRRLQRWRQQAPFDDERQWRLRLADLGLLAATEGTSACDLENAEAKLLELLATPEDLPTTVPPWLEGCRRLYLPQEDDGADVQGIAASGFLRALRPLLDEALARLDRSFEGLGVSATKVDWQSLRRDWMRLLVQRLRQRILPTMVLELRIAGLENRLQGESPEDRFESFLRRLDGSTEAWSLLSRYPALLRLLWGDLERWLASARELLKRVDGGWLALTEFLGEDPGPLQRVIGSGGDPHRQGRQVLFTSFAGGRRLVYKPRSLALEAGFQELMVWAGEQGLEVPRPSRLLPREGPGSGGTGGGAAHGWMEWLEPTPCTHAAQVSRFYRRQGGLLAFLHLLGATDLHHENVMAVADQPLVVDLETLCHPPLANPEPSPWRRFGDFEDSVLRVGLLPLRLRSAVDQDLGLDASGLGAEAGQRTPGGAWQLQGEGTDAMRLVSGDGTLGATPGRPVLNGEAVDAAAYGEQVAAGFAAARRVMRKHRRELLAAEGPLAGWRGLASRVVVRPTQLYGRLLQESLHPQLLAEAVDRDRHFDRLWLQIPTRPWLRSVVASESRDLRRGDIPYFHGRTDSRHLWDAAGQDLGPLLAESGMEGIARRLSQLDGAATERQLALVRQAFELRAAEKGLRPRPRSVLDDSGGALVDPEGLLQACLETAQEIADDLTRLAFVDGRGARWWAPRRLGQGRWTLTEAGPDLYFGLSGLALFYQQLAELGGRAVDREMAAATLRALRHQLALDEARLADLGLRGIGAFSGWGGVIYSLTVLAERTGRRELADLAQHHVEDVARRLSTDEQLDVVAGAAGAILALLRLARLRPRSAALGLARRCGEHLLDRARAQQTGRAWPSPGGARGPLAGLSHGAAGMAWALFELASAVDGEQRARCFAGGLAALDYEESLYPRGQGNWPDLRAKPEGHEDHGLLAWCHGAPGIGLARLATLQCLRASGLMSEGLAQRLQRDVQRSVDVTWRHGFGLTHCLCHGDLGNLDFLFEAAAAGTLPAEVQSIHTLELRTGQILASIRRQGCLFGTPGGTEPPGLLVGRAGIAWGLLRLAAPRRVVSVLRLAHGGGDAASKSWGVAPQGAAFLKRSGDVTRPQPERRRRNEKE